MHSNIEHAIASRNNNRRRVLAPSWTISVKKENLKKRYKGITYNKVFNSVKAPLSPVVNKNRTNSIFRTDYLLDRSTGLHEHLNVKILKLKNNNDRYETKINARKRTFGSREDIECIRAARKSGVLHFMVIPRADDFPQWFEVARVSCISCHSLFWAQLVFFWGFRPATAVLCVRANWINKRVPCSWRDQHNSRSRVHYYDDRRGRVVQPPSLMENRMMKTL